MSGFALSSVSSVQQSLLGYLGAWSTLSLSQSRLDPFSIRHLPLSMQQGIANGMMHREGMEPASATSYVRMAASHERALLVSLGVDAHAIESFVDTGVSYGSYFEDPLHPWQENSGVGRQVVRQLESLHTAIEGCRERLQAWKSSGERFKLIREEFGLSRFLGEPLNGLKTVLERNVARARLSIRDHGLSEEGVLVFLNAPSSRSSGVYARCEALDYGALETIPPPPAL